MQKMDDLVDKNRLSYKCLGILGCDEIVVLKMSF